MGAPRVALRALVLASGALLPLGAGVSCGEVPMDCTTGRGDFAVEFLGVDACGLGNGDIVGAQTYQGRGPSDATGVPQPDLGAASAAVQVQRLGVLRDRALLRQSRAGLSGTPYAHGKWVTPRPDAKNFCSVSSMAAAISHLAVPAEPADDPLTPDEDETIELVAENKTYAFSNVRFYNTPGIQGLQFDADLTYTDALFPGGPCTTIVKAVGVYPAPNCMVPITVSVPADPNVPGSEPATYLTGSMPDESVCSDISKGGISSDFPTHCVPATAPEFQEPVFTCTDTLPPVCTPSVPEVRVPTHGFCFLLGRDLPVLK